LTDVKSRELANQLQLQRRHSKAFFVDPAKKFFGWLGAESLI
jgi:hypothetical protein